MRKKSYKFVIVILLIFLILSNFSTIVTSNEISRDSFFGKKDSKNSDMLDIFSMVNNSILRNYIRNIESFGPHPTGSESLENLKLYLFNVLNSSGLDVDLISWSAEGYSGYNIEATLEGRNNDSGVFVVCAHYDSVDVSPGADDDGSGVSIVLSAADILSDYVFNSTIKFVLFSGEEQGLLGSRDYVARILERNVNVVGVLNLDGLGYAATSEDGSKIRHYANAQSSWMKDISLDLSEKYYEYIGLEIRLLPHVTFSDHHAFVEKGYEASYFLENTLNPYYHTSEDRSENINFTYLSKVCKLSLGCLFVMAELNPKTFETDLNIQIKGQILSENGQISVGVINSNYLSDTVNLTVNIRLEPIFLNKILSEGKSAYKDPYNWTVDKEINESWFFKTMNRAFPSGLFKIKVELKGFNDDIYIYKYLETYGIVLFKYFVVLIPKNI